MRGSDYQQADMFSYLSPEQRVPEDHPLRTLEAMKDEILGAMSPLFDTMYASDGRPSIPPEKLLRAQLLQMLYSVRSERLRWKKSTTEGPFINREGIQAEEPGDGLGESKANRAAEESMDRHWRFLPSNWTRT
jgi:hypothetical protein